MFVIHALIMVALVLMFLALIAELVLNLITTEANILIWLSFAKIARGLTNVSPTLSSITPADLDLHLFNRLSYLPMDTKGLKKWTYKNY